MGSGGGATGHRSAKGFTVVTFHVGQVPQAQGTNIGRLGRRYNILLMVYEYGGHERSTRRV